MDTRSGDVVVALPTPYGRFAAHAFERPSGQVYVAVVAGDVRDRDDVLVRIHSECLTGDALGSLRCDCGVQLREGLRSIAAAGSGVLIYATDHEGRGIGLMNKLRAYLMQERGADTVDANQLLGLPADARDYGDAADVLRSLGVASVRLMTNNPAKVAGLRVHGVEVRDVVPVRTVPHPHNERYLTTKAERMAHDFPSTRSPATVPVVDDPRVLLGPMSPRMTRPAVALKVAQSLDGRIATRTGDSKWISSDAERRIAHALRAACDAVMVGVGTVLADNPHLTVRDAPGASPIRVVVDSGLRIPATSHLLTDDGSTIVVTTDASASTRRAEVRGAGVAVEVVASRDDRVDLTAALARLRELGIESVLVEGGAQLATALLHDDLVDRLVVSIAPLLLGTGVAVIGDLGTDRVVDAVRLTDRIVAMAGDDILVAGTIQR